MEFFYLALLAFAIFWVVIIFVMIARGIIAWFIGVVYRWLRRMFR